MELDTITLKGELETINLNFTEQISIALESLPVMKVCPL